MSINFLGSYSGVDQSTIDQLINIEKRPLVQLSQKKTTMESQKNSWNDVRTRLTTLFDKIKALQNSETFSAKIASDGESVALTVSRNTPEGTYDISVSQLATRASVVGGTIGAITAPDGDSNTELGLTGKFSINDAAHESANVIEVTESDTVRTISDKINAISKESGVRSAIIDNRLVLTNIKTGETGINITDLEGGSVLSEIGLNTSVTTEDGGPKTIEGKNAHFTVNGVEVVRPSNNVNNVIEYTTINLTKEHAIGKADSIVVSKDTSKVEEAVKGFVDQYNSTMNFITDKLKAGTPGETASRGSLAGDSSLMRLQSSLRSMVTSSIANENTGIGDISQLGVSTVDRFGQLSFDATKLKDALNEDPTMVQNFFSSKNTEGKEIGFVSRLNGYIDSFSSSSGIIKGKTDSFDRSLKDINKQVESFNLRMVKKEAYYVNMFAKLDTAMMQAESQMSWLTSQVSAMSPTKK